MTDRSAVSDPAVEALLSDDDARFVVAVTPEGDLRVAHVAPGLPARIGIEADVVGESPSALAGPLGDGIAAACRNCRDDGESRTHLGDTVGDAVFETELSPVREDGSVSWIVGTVRDVTERERLRTEAEEAEELLTGILDNVPIHLYVKDAQARHLAVSDFYVDRLPFVSDRSEMVGLTDEEVLPGEMGTDSLADDRRVIEEAEPVIKKETHVPALDMWTLTSKIPWESEGETKGLVGVTIDITKRKQYARELERRNEQLSEYASIISHDLRNPLNTAQGFLPIARDSGDPEHFENVRAGIDRALEITEGLERLVRATDEVEPRSVDVDAVARRAWEEFGSPDGSLDVDPALSIDADENWLRTLFENLFKNAVEHAGEDVAVTVTPLESAAGFAVADDGPGIPPEDRTRVFDTTHSTKGDGGGVGLWIVARIVDAHGWEVSVTESASGGARFEVRTD